MRCSSITILFSLLLLPACGGDSQQTTSAPLPASAAIETVNVDLSGQNGTFSSTSQQIL